AGRAGRALRPAADRRGRGARVERVVDLDRRKARDVVREHGARVRAFGIEGAHPVGVAPAGRAEPDAQRAGKRARNHQARGAHWAPPRQAGSNPFTSSGTSVSEEKRLPPEAPAAPPSPVWRGPDSW